MKLRSAVVSLALFSAGAPAHAQTDQAFPYRLGMSPTELQAATPSWHWVDEVRTSGNDSAEFLHNGPPLTIGGIQFTPTDAIFDRERRLGYVYFSAPSQPIAPEECMAKAGFFITDLIAMFGPLDQSRVDSAAQSLATRFSRNAMFADAHLEGQVDFRGGHTPIMTYSEHVLGGGVVQLAGVGWPASGVAFEAEGRLEAPDPFDPDDERAVNCAFKLSMYPQS